MPFSCTILRKLLLIALLPLFATETLAQARDVAGARDYPGIGRFGGSVITGYVMKNFDAVRVQAAPFKEGKAQDERRLEGRITRIAYKTGTGPSILEVARNFEQQIEKAGYTTLLRCDTDACGGGAFVERVDVLPIPMMWADGFNFHYFAGHKKSDSGETYVSLIVSSNNNEIWAQLTVAELGAMENKMVDAAAMAKGIQEKGHIALYGIYFDTDKATLKAESRPALDEIAKFLAAQPKLSVYIVGHTDSQGSFRHNMDLSRRRAEAVAETLVLEYSVAKKRLQTAGVGYLAPVGSNATEDGRALNRRVELVAP